MKNVHKVEITHKTIIFTVLFLISCYLTFVLRDIILLLFISLFIMAAINPLVVRLERYKLPRTLSITLVYILTYSCIITAIALIIPPFLYQLVNLINQIKIPPSFFSNFGFSKINLQDLQVIANQLDTVPKVFSVITSAFSVIFIIVTITVMSFYLLIDRKNLHKNILFLFDKDKAENKAEEFINKIEHQIGSWVRGELSLMLIVGLLTYIGLSAFNISFALPLAIIAGILEILPNIGPVVSAIPAIAIAYFGFSLPMAIAVSALYVLIQQLENNFIVPFIMKKTVGINPVATILLLLIGFRLGQVAGAALSIPLYLILKIAFTEYRHFKHHLIQPDNSGK